MSEAARRSRRTGTRASLAQSVLRIAAIAAAAAVLLWAALFLDLVRKHADAASPSAGTPTTQRIDPGASAQPPASVTTRTS
jgi:hypothetical protein